MTLPPIPPHRPVLIAGPTASGKSALALQIAETEGGVIINADALQVFSDWRVLTARPSAAEEARVPHRLYGHVPGTQPYSVGAWLRDIDPLLDRCDRPIIVGGTGLYFRALTEGLADIPATDLATRRVSEAVLADEGLAAMVAALDAPSRASLDIANPRRVQRAWEVLRMTGRGIAAWQAETPPPRLDLAAATAIVVELPVATLNARIAARFAAMIAEGALDEARDNAPTWSPNQPSAKAIGAAELVAHVRGEMSLDVAREQATIATRQFAKRQRTWFRSRMPDWHRYTPPPGHT